MKTISFSPQFGKGIRGRLLGAFAIVVFISMAAVLAAGISITRTQDKLDGVVTETLPLVHNSLKLDKETRFFALTINDFPEITTSQEYKKLTSRLEQHSLEIQSLLQTLEALDFEKEQVQLIRERVEMLVKLMEEQDQQFHDFFLIHHHLRKAVEALRKQHKNFIELARPRISESYATYLQKGDEVKEEIREIVSLVGSGSTELEISKIDDKLRVGFETLISSAAGEMRSSMEAVALTYLAAGLLNEAASSTDIETARQLEASFLHTIPKIKRVQLILSYSNPENHQMIIAAMPIFRFGLGDHSIFSLRIQELSLRNTASISAQHALSLAGDLTESIETLTATSQSFALQAAASLRSSLYKAQVIQVIAGLAAIVFSVVIGWFYVDKSVISRLSMLKESMEQHSTGGDAEIPLSGNDEISEMAFALQRFVVQRESIENRLRTTLDELNAVMDSIDYGVAFMDQDQRVLLVNKAFQEMWNIDGDEIVGHPITDLVHPKLKNHFTRDRSYAADSQAGRHHGSPDFNEQVSMEIETEDGKTFQHQCITLPSKARMLTYFDITELKRNQEKLIHAKKIETIGLMAGGVAHDLNNILSGIVSYPDLMLLKLPQDSELRKPINDIKESGQRAAAVVADLLTVTRGATAERVIDNLNRLVKQYLHSPERSELTNRYPNIDIRTELFPELLNLSCAPVQITKCLMNLVMNAAEAINQSGTIILTTRNRYFDRTEATDHQLMEGEYVCLSVHDDGPGISPDNIEHIFEPFYSRKVLGRSGTGLGLTIVWNTVKDHEGTVTVQSSPEGTTFDLYFPVSRDAAAEMTLSAPEAAIQGNNESILVVDDEALQRSIASQILNSLGYRVVTAASGEEAIQLVKENDFDLVILDMIMSPGINGRATYEQIARIRPGQKAVIATGYSADEEVKRAQDLGIKGIIYKPYTLHEFGMTVKDILT